MLFQTALIGITKYIKRQNHKIKSQTVFSHEQVLSLFVKYNSTSPLHNSAYIYHRRFTYIFLKPYVATSITMLGYIMIMSFNAFNQTSLVHSDLNVIL